MRLTKWLALLLTICLLIGMTPVALSEDIEIDIEDGNTVETDSDIAELDPELNLDLSEDVLALELPELEQEEIPANPNAAAEENDGELLDNAKNYTDLSNDTAFTLNGVTVRASDEGTKGSGNCWKWAQAIYKKVWGCNFDSTFEGTASKGHNLVRNLTDDERRLTPENLKHMVSSAKPGATLRVQSCPSSCSGFNTDGCSKHNLHSLIIAEIRDDGLVTMDDQGSVHTRYYTWEGFCASWSRWEYVKYIKWPNAPALTSAESIDGYGVSKFSETYRVVSSASKGTGVFTTPESGKLLETLKYPATFSASARTLKTFEGYTWAYGTSSGGVTGWLPLTDAVASSSQTIPVTNVMLDQSAVVMAKGGTFTLNAAIVPVDASNQSVTWSSSDDAVVSVSGGVLSAKDAGTATITVTTVDGGLTASCSVKVADADAGKELTKTGNNGSVTLSVGSKLQLIPTFATAKGWKVKSVSSSKSKVASVNKTGMVTAKKAGTTTITVKCKNGKKATLKVKVVDASKGSTGTTTTSTEVRKIYLNRVGTVSMKVGTTLQLYTKLDPETATTTLTWKSSNEKIAFVDNTGRVYAIKKGICSIGVMAENGVYATVKIKVT